MLHYLLASDALALYVEPNPAELIEELQREHAASETHYAWLNISSRFFRAIVLTQGDGTVAEVFSREITGLDVIDGPVKAATEQIEKLDWFQTNRRRLVWDEDRDLCLKLRA